MDVDNSRAAPAARRWFGIGARMATLVCALVAVACLAGGLWSYVRLRDGLLREEFSRQRVRADSAGAQLAAGIEGLRQDAAFLAETPPVVRILRARLAGGADPVDGLGEQYWRERLADIFQATLRAKPQYFQIRLIGTADQGREIVRAERQGTEVSIVPDELLQEKGDRSYFQEAIQSPPGAVYLSRIELNEDHGRISEPRVPTLRAATVIAGPDRKPFGLLVINKDVGLRFAQMKAALGGRYSLYVFDENLEFLLHPDASRAFGFQLGQSFRVTEEFPELREILFASGNTQTLADNVNSGETMIASLSRVQPDPGVSSRSYGLLLTAKYADAVAASIELRNQTMVFAFLLLAATVGTVLVVSGRLTRPLAEITTAAQGFAQGRQDLKLPLQAGDEAGVLARAFDEMFRVVRHNETRLQAEVAERRRAATAWRESEHRLRLALDAAQAGVWEWNIETDQTSWDKTIRDAVAADSENFPETSAAWLALVHPDDRAAIPAERQRAIEENRPYGVDFRIRGPKGEGPESEWRYRSARGVVVRDDAGRPLKLLGISSDVTEEKLAQAAQTESAERLRLALVAAQAGAWEWDLRTDQTTWDSSIEGMAGFDPATFPGSIVSWLEQMHPDDVNNVPDARRRTLEDGRPFEAEFRIRGRLGDWRHWNARGILVRDEAGQPLKLVGISWDVTDARQAQEQIREYAAELERKNREMEQFVYSVSHDLKSPLVTCKGFTGILKEDLADGRISEAMDSAERVERATQHMGRLIEDLLQLSRVGRVTDKPQTVDVSALVSELAEELRLVSKPGVRVNTQPDMPPILADPVAISRLFQNLLANAFHYGCRGVEPCIEVGSHIAGDEIRFFVRDNGPGISPEYHDKIFGLFQRLEANQDGTGIGLAIVSKIMEVHGGRAWVESTPGAGATFWLGFPRRFLVSAEPALSRNVS